MMRVLPTSYVCWIIDTNSILLIGVLREARPRPTFPSPRVQSTLPRIQTISCRQDEPNVPHRELDCISFKCYVASNTLDMLCACFYQFMEHLRGRTCLLQLWLNGTLFCMKQILLIDFSKICLLAFSGTVSNTVLIYAWYIHAYIHRRQSMWGNPHDIMVYVDRSLCWLLAFLSPFTKVRCMAFMYAFYTCFYVFMNRRFVMFLRMICIYVRKKN